MEYLESVVADGAPGTREAGEELLRRIREGSGSERRRALELKAALAPDLRPVAGSGPAPTRGSRAAGPRGPQRARAFHLAMLQARIFNRVLEVRRAAGNESTVLVGDVVLAADGRHRVVLEDDPPEAREGLVPTGPLWAATGLHAAGEPGRIELAALREEGLELEDLRSPGGLRPRGARRPLVVALSDLEVDGFEDGAAWIRFSLPVGSFATVVLAAIGSSFAGVRSQHAAPSSEYPGPPMDRLILHLEGGEAAALELTHEQLFDAPAADQVPDIGALIPGRRGRGVRFSWSRPWRRPGTSSSSSRWSPPTAGSPRRSPARRWRRR